MTQAYDRALAPSGLKLSQFSLMAMLERLGDTPLTVLADKLVLDRTTLTRNLKPLMDRGLIETVEAADRRVRRLRLSRDGEAALGEARPRWEKAQARMILRLGPDHWQRLLDDLAIAVTVAVPDDG